MNALVTPEYGVAVLGYSFMGKAHSNAWRNVGAFFPDVPRVRQTVLAGRDATHVAAAAKQYGWQDSETDWRRVLERPDVDIVDICLPGHLHAEVAEAALAAGKHVLVEKPLANDVTQAESMVRAAVAARKHGVHSMVGFNYRRVPALALAHDVVLSGRIGALRQARICYLQDWLTDESAPMVWRLRREEAGSGAIGDLASHVVDLLLYLTGDTVTSVSATTRTFVPERRGPSGPEPVTVEDAAWATLQTASGMVASLEVSRMAAGRKNGLTIELYGSRGSVSFALENLNQLRVHETDVPGSLSTAGTTDILVTEPDHPYLEAWWPPGHLLGWDHTFTHQAGDLLRCLAADTKPTPSFEDGLAVQRVLGAIEQSHAEDARRVPLAHPGVTA
ncbi:MAG TPA: Gfo/Idh/MocA family oxidoreductase [Nocardioidaceae bacterium]|nr:Gfo/Idh/MocA family oxidoreductase [Nocardioidaceae bacterium]